MIDHEYGDPYYSSKFASGYGYDCLNCDYYEDLVPDVCYHTNREQMDGTYVAPTCTEKGYVTLVCLDCNYQWNREYSAIGHTWSDPYYSVAFSTGYGHDCTVCKYIEDLQAPNCTHENREPIDGSDLPATCTAPGYISYKCLDCEKTWQETIDALGHTWSDPYYSNAFSTGYGHKCTVCEYIEELGVPECSHENREPIDGSYAPATCTALGYISYKCLDCEKTWQETIPILPHTWGDPYYSNAFSTGYGHKCTVCEYIEDLDAPECSHENREPIDGSDVPATCTAPGYISYKCLDCEKTWQETIAALGHDHSVGVVVPPVSCKEKGYTYYKCSHDGCTSYIVDASSYVVGDHVPEVVSFTAATCVSDGLNKRECSLCGTALKDEVVSATGHNYCDPVVIPAKCTEIGFTLVQCLNPGCNKTIKSDEVSALGHVYVDGVCSRCQAVQSTEPSVHEHIWGTVEIIKATCETDGQTIQECACGEKRTIIAEKTGHLWSEAETIVPTCSKSGITRVWCLNECGKEQVIDFVEALGHEYVDGVCTRCRALEKLPETTAPSGPDQGSSEGKDDAGSIGSIFEGLVEGDEDLTPLFLRYLGMVIFFMIIFAALAPDPKKRKRRRRRR